MFLSTESRTQSSRSRRPLNEREPSKLPTAQSLPERASKRNSCSLSKLLIHVLCARLRTLPFDIQSKCSPQLYSPTLCQVLRRKERVNAELGKSVQTSPSGGRRSLDGDAWILSCVMQRNFETPRPLLQQIMGQEKPRGARPYYNHVHRGSSEGRLVERCGVKSSVLQGKFGQTGCESVTKA